MHQGRTLSWEASTAGIDGHKINKFWVSRLLQGAHFTMQQAERLYKPNYHQKTLAWMISVRCRMKHHTYINARFPSVSLLPLGMKKRMYVRSGRQK